MTPLALISPLAGEIRDRWCARRDELRRLNASVDGAAICDEAIADIEMIVADAAAKRLTLQEAAELSGYSADHLGRLLRDGKLRNVGRKHAPRILLGDLPKRIPKCLAPGLSRSYDPLTDARSLRVRR